MTELLRVSPPAFVRKLGRKRYWGSPDQQEHARVEEIINNVFLNDAPPYSLYRVDSDTDLERVALALNAGRTQGSLTEDSAFVAFLPSEIESVGITLQPSIGDTPCHLANNLHVDAAASEAQIRQLIAAAVQSGRQVASLTKGAMKRVVERATKEKCRAAVPSAEKCEVVGCSPAGG